VVGYEEGKEVFSISTTFRARGKTGGTYYAVTIGAINKNGTYSIDFSSSKIQIVSPLTKESISKRNGGNGNWGKSMGANINQIEIIEEEKKKKIVKNI
jgi:hypothetical protein